MHLEKQTKGFMEYKTQTRQQIMEFMEKNPDRIFKASEIAQSLPNISLSTIYRNLSRLENSGMLQVVGAESNNELRYRYIGCSCCQAKIHLICKKCGKLSHLDGPTLKVLMNAVEKLSGFVVDRQESVLQGCCQSCCRESQGAELNIKGNRSKNF